MNHTTTYYLGIDWGRSKIGLALADSEMQIASAFKEIEANNIETEMDTLQQEYQIEKIIIGRTQDMVTFSGANKEAINTLVTKLQDKGFQVEFEEERFTTQLAQHNLSQTGAKGISKQDNAEAARIILQSWLDRNSR